MTTISDLGGPTYSASTTVSMAVRSDGRPLIVFGGTGFPVFPEVFSGVVLFDCVDSMCTNGSLRQTPLTEERLFSDPKIVLRSDGRPLITVQTSRGLVLLNCADSLCSDATQVPIYPNGTSNAAVAIGSQDQVMLAYADINFGPLEARVCAINECAPDEIFANGFEG